ncbi:MAG: energy-coupling factor transporter transmembrane protein EcfT [Clostridia bacterium]|nr:energy-coupling factor transporter transmembrane protein EcfT [Clostridia bacterium]
MAFFKPKYKLFPLVNVIAAVAIIIFGLVMAKHVECSYFLIALFVWLCIFGCARSCVRMLAAFIIVGGIFAGITYAASGSAMSALAMANRFGAVFSGMAVASACESVSTVRALSQVHTPRSITLGMLITTSFMPLLKTEIRRVREAMKTRGAGGMLNPKIFYRAFLVPLVMRLVNISDTLSLSVETRGFALGKVKYSVYKPERVAITDILFLIGLIIGMVLTVIL